MTEELDVMEVVEDVVPVADDSKQDSQEFEVFHYQDEIFIFICCLIFWKTAKCCEARGGSWTLALIGPSGGQS